MNELNNFINSAYTFKLNHSAHRYNQIEVYAKISRDYWFRIINGSPLPYIEYNTRYLKDQGIDAIIHNIKIMVCSQKHDCTFLFKEVD